MGYRVHQKFNPISKKLQTADIVTNGGLIKRSRRGKFVLVLN
jgi:hypothetical protein